MPRFFITPVLAPKTHPTTTENAPKEMSMVSIWPLANFTLKNSSMIYHDKQIIARALNAFQTRKDGCALEPKCYGGGPREVVDGERVGGLCTYYGSKAAH